MRRLFRVILAQADEDDVSISDGSLRAFTPGPRGLTPGPTNGDITRLEIKAFN